MDGFGCVICVACLSVVGVCCVGWRFFFCYRELWLVVWVACFFAFVAVAISGVFSGSVLLRPVPDSSFFVCHCILSCGLLLGFDAPDNNLSQKKRVRQTLVCVTVNKHGPPELFLWWFRTRTNPTPLLLVK